MFREMFTNGAGRIVLFALALLAPCVQNTVFGQALTMDGQSGTEPASPQHDRFCLPMTPDVDAAQNEITSPALDGNPNEERTTSSRASATDSWGPVPTRKASVANLAPYLLPYFNNGPVFGLPGTDSKDFRYRTQLSGDWGGLRTDLAHHGFFLDLYSTSAYQDVASGGLKTGSAFVQNTQLSINMDSGRAGLWPGGVFHVTLEARNGSSSPQDTFTAGCNGAADTPACLPGPLSSH